MYIPTTNICLGLKFFSVSRLHFDLVLQIQFEDRLMVHFSSSLLFKSICSNVRLIFLFDSSHLLNVSPKFSVHRSHLTQVAPTLE